MKQSELLIICGLEKCRKSWSKTKIIDTIIEVKQLYPSWKLEYVRVCGSFDTMPPKSLYEFDFITPEGVRFSRGGCKRVN